jgi:hypothetical protein
MRWGPESAASLHAGWVLPKEIFGWAWCVRYQILQVGVWTIG